MKNSRRIIVLSFLVLCFLLSGGFSDRANAASKSINLGFEPFDTVLDPHEPVVYMTQSGSRVIYGVNYETGVIETLELPYIAERLTIYDGTLYVTQLKFKHSSTNFGPYNGSVAMVSTRDFSFQEMLPVSIDPYDLIVDKDGYLYITSGSGQHSYIRVYSLADKTEVKNSSLAGIYQSSSITYNQTLSRLYTTDSTISPRDIDAYDVHQGVISSKHDSPYHGDFQMSKEAKISPDDKRIYSASSVFSLAKEKEQDLLIQYTFDEVYNDFEFSLKDNLTFAASRDGGIHVYTYDTNEYVYTLKRNVTVDKLLFKNGLLAFYSDGQGNHLLEYMKDYSAGPFSVDEQSFTAYDKSDTLRRKELVNQTKNIPTSSEFKLTFNHKMTLKDKGKITLKSPTGNMNVRVAVNKNQLTIAPEYLMDYTTYTLTIGKGALADYAGKSLAKDHTIQFTTAVAPVAELTMALNSNKAPLAYTFTANASGGRDPLYQFEVFEGYSSQGRVLQTFSPSPNFLWRPSHQGTYTVKVSAKSKESAAVLDKAYRMEVTVVDEELPVMTIMQSTTSPTSKPVDITIQGYDNLGIRSITLPNNDIVYNDKALYTVSRNGTYTFEIEDLMGNTNKKSIQINNIDSVKPTIVLSASTTEPTKKDVTIVVNTADNIRVKSIQLPDGKRINGSNAIYVVSKSGEYTFTVEDAAGNVTTKSITIKNIFKGNPEISIVETVSDSHEVVKGKATPNTTVFAKKGQTILNSAKASSKGNYSIKIPKQKAGTKITVYAKDPLNHISKTKTVTVIDKTAPPTPKINKVTSNAKVLTGKAEKGATVYIYNGKKYVNKGIVDASGNIKITIAKQKKGITLTVFAKDKAGNKSKVRLVKVA
ncbi:Ig-like domain-containing protein [Peribacillus sp. NPDC097295]|uniref:Ig-like domain-containing protein n=1 Tax=Peribacillus sp. NPDC097295 TaxID=3364402 RepID=UPI003813D7D7